MRKVCLAACLSLMTMVSWSQSYKKMGGDGSDGGFDLNKVFVGGNVSLGYGGGSGGSAFTIGVSPEIGYSLSQYFDAGINFNSIYNTTSYNPPAYDNYGNGITRVNSFNYGIGAFARIHPFQSFFIQAQPELNWFANAYKYNDYLGNPGKQKQTVSAASFLVGVGYGQRIIGQASFFTTLMIDLGTERNSPYRDYYGNIVPVIRGGFNFYLGQGKKK